jgi:signal transduction histidine kinase
MAIARQIVDAHGGQIELGTAERGAEFIITLPRNTS